MSDDKYKNLRELADKATQGPWHVFRAGVCMGDETFVHSRSEGGRADSGYIAAANPEVIRELLDERDELQKELNSELLEGITRLGESGRNYGLWQAWKAAAEHLESLSGYDEIEHDDDCLLKAARTLEEES
jgi:hypothetical protein